MTGGTGFLGKELVQIATSSRDLKLIVLTRFPDMKNRENSSNNLLKFVGSNEESIHRIFQSEKIDGILHMATNYGRKHADFSQVIEINLQLPLMLLEMGAKNGSSHFINIDSFFNKPGNNYFALPEYALTKKSLSLFLPEYAGRLEISNLILEHVYGPNDSPEKFIPYLMREMVSAGVGAIRLSPGNQIRDFIYVKDAALGILKVMEKKVQHIGIHTFGLGTGIGTTLMDFAESLKRISGSSVYLDFGGVQYSKNEIMYSCADNSSLKELGRSPSYSVPDGISEMLNA